MAAPERRSAPQEANLALIWGPRAEPAIDDEVALAAFMDDAAQTFAHRAVEGYTRARARRDPDALLARPDIAGLVERASAEAFPIALTLVAETVESALVPQAYDRVAQLRGLIAVAQVTFARRPEPAAMTASAWTTARAELVRWLGNATRHPPRTTDAIVEPFVGPLLALMPIHDDLGRDDFPLLRAALREDLARVRERFAARVNAPTLAKALAGRA